MDEEKKKMNALTDANGIMREKRESERVRRVKEVESKPNEINPYVLINDLFFIIFEFLFDIDISFIYWTNINNDYKNHLNDHFLEKYNTFDYSRYTFRNENAI